MATSNKNLHLTDDERKIIQRGIENNSSKKSIADTLGKDKSTIGKEIKNHRTLSYKSKYPVECVDTGSMDCPAFKPFICKRRDRSPGACNGCERYKRCRFDKYMYDASAAQKEYAEMLCDARAGVNATVNEIRDLGLLIKPLLEQGQSLYVICQNHPEIKVSERTLYTYIEDGVFQDAGVSITNLFFILISNLDLKKKVRRKISKSRKTQYAKRQDRSYLKGRTHLDYTNYMEENPDARIVEMDTVYNDVSNGPFIQTFKFLQYDLLICIYHESKTTDEMLRGILLLEQYLGPDIFNAEVLLTDRGSEFVSASEAEYREDGSRRTRVYYCDSMCSWQKGSLENVHLLLREICPNKTDLYALGLTSQEKANIISSHINSYPKKKLKGKSSFQLLEFINPVDKE